MRIPVCFMLTVVILGGRAFAADLEPASRIDSVIIHPDAAVVTRLTEVEMPAGANTVLLRGLPAALDASSIRVEGTGNAAFVILGVDVRAAPGEAEPVIDRALEDKVKALKDEAETVAGRIEALDRKKNAIQVYANASPEKLSPEAKPLDVSQWTAAWDAIGEGTAKVNEELRIARVRSRDLSKEIATLEAARPKPIAPGLPKSDLAIALESASAVRGTLRFTYRVGGAGWVPTYDARLATGDTGVKPSLTLVRRASLTQRTGEDWNDVRLSVSTVDTQQGTDAPKVAAVLASLYEARHLGGRGSAEPSASEADGEAVRGLRMDDMVAAQKPAPAVIPAQQAVEQTARLDATGFTVMFSVPGRVSVPADGSSKTVLLGSLSVEPTLLVESAPLLDVSAYIHTSFVLKDEAPIFPGVIMLQRDGVLVGKDKLELVAPGDKVELGFGVDDRIKITRTPLQRRQSEPGLFGSNKTDVQQFKTVVKNLHEYPMKVRIVDRLPYSENAAVQVEMATDSAPPTEKDIDGRRGVVRWDVDVPAGGEKEIRFGYTVKWPADKRLVVQ